MTDAPSESTLVSVEVWAKLCGISQYRAWREIALVCIPLNWPPQSAPKWPRRPGFWPICVGASGDEGEVEGLSLFITSFQ